MSGQYDNDFPVGKTIFGGFAFILAVLALSWLFMGNDFFMYKYFAPKQEAVRRQVFEQTKSYNQGMVQELQNMQFQYIQADKNHQDALADLILHRAADFDLEQPTVPADLRQFILKLRRERVEAR